MRNFNFHLPSISAHSDRDKREERRSLEAAKIDILIQRANLKADRAKLMADHVVDLERLAGEQEVELQAQRRRQLDGAITALDRLNPGDALTNFHGLRSISETFQTPINTLRRNYIAHRALIQARSKLPAIEAEDPNRALKMFVNRCVTGGEKASVVWNENKDKMIDLNCGRSTFYDTVNRLKRDPSGDTRVKRGRPELLTPELVNHIANNKSKDLAGKHHK
jgi:hypothetical protein